MNSRYALNEHGQPISSGLRWADNEIKAVNTLYGLCMGILADGKVDDREVLFLDTWLKDHQAFLGAYPLNVVAARVADILADGVISQDECHDLYEMLGKLVGGTVEETGTAGGQATGLPLDNISGIDFFDKSFCFTGQFIFGTRAKCEQAVMDLGGRSSSNITKRLDYLVIGELASRDWVTTGHGRKIEKALHYKAQGVPMFIVGEQDWTRFVL